ncbi:hypothetical protein F442_00490 [Phytophthora nicotianae P10297]|uniref:Uncharacterized protein n=2 Tax=Phytophthora nicotianae TaxID=4792 RepID=W3A6M9_PHYNI|nr:hypothetical protein L915_00471 [Phytophthora nicotianae]ETP54885.1 hypothetical protein F442_00490 [Phytophthora nicotianae P10297]
MLLLPCGLSHLSRFALGGTQEKTFFPAQNACHAFLLQGKSDSVANSTINALTQLNEGGNTHPSLTFSTLWSLKAISVGARVLEQTRGPSASAVRVEVPRKKQNGVEPIAIAFAMLPLTKLLFIDDVYDEDNKTAQEKSRIGAHQTPMA